MSFIFKIIAKNPPTVLFVIALFSISTDSMNGTQALIDFGNKAFGWGVILQILLLIVQAIKKVAYNSLMW